MVRERGYRQTASQPDRRARARVHVCLCVYVSLSMCLSVCVCVCMCVCVIPTYLLLDCGRERKKENLRFPPTRRLYGPADSAS